MNGLDWLLDEGIVLDDRFGVVLAPEAAGLSEAAMNRTLFAICVEARRPPWLQDAESLIRDPGQLPLDALDAARALALSEVDAWGAVRHVHGKLDLAERQRVGSLGEAGLVQILENRWPGSTDHIALEHDGFGYDIDFAHRMSNWHLEVKSTSRRGQLEIYLSRHEFEVSQQDSSWQLVVLGITDAGKVACIATVDTALVWLRSPSDTHRRASWQSVRLELRPGDLSPGMGFLSGGSPSGLLNGALGNEYLSFEWMPSS